LLHANKVGLALANGQLGRPRATAALGERQRDFHDEAGGISAGILIADLVA
jgi:hypothetical protein